MWDGSEGREWSLAAKQWWVVVYQLAKSCLTLCNLMGYNPLGSSIHGISQARVLEWVAISSSRDSS